MVPKGVTVGGNVSPIGGGPTPETAARIAELVKDFRSRGGTVRLPPHQPGEHGIWVLTAMRYWDRFERLPPAAKTLRLEAGLSYMWVALLEPQHMVALLDGALAAAMAWVTTPGALRTRFIGSRQHSLTRGAGHALEFELVKDAVSKGVGIRGVYPAYPGARSFHEGLGRRLDQSGPRSTEWTAADCAFILVEVNARL